MAVFQPNAVLGNSRSLLTFGSAGELMTLFYPHIDFPQNVQEGMPAVYLGPRGQGTLSWTFEEDWEKQQAYVPRRNILVTTLTHRAGVRLTITDLVLPQQDVLVRQFRLENIGTADVEGVLMQYLYLRLGEMARKNSARKLDDAHAVVQYWRNICFAMGGDPCDATQIGKAGSLSGSSAKRDMADGYLTNQREELGDVDTAYAWNFWLRPGEEFTRLFLISAHSSESAALAQLQECAARGFEALYAETDAWWEAWLSAAQPVELEPSFMETYYRCLLTMRLLYDERYGSFLAAPEFDPSFERCGGYGFVWPRDAAEVVLALEQAGFPEMVERFFDWARESQHARGYWEQRYWISGERGPGWCSFLDSIQIDQTGSMVYALGVHANRLSGEERQAFQERYWPMVEAAVSYLHDALSEQGLHTQAFDLWEKFRGSFTYSNAAIAAAFGIAVAWAEARGETERPAHWRADAVRIKSMLLGKCWDGQCFARGFNERGELDWGVDSSVLGMLDPFELLTLDDPDECAMVERVVETIRARLTQRLPDGDAIIRHEGDDYVDGSAGGVNTLWLARVLLRLSAQHAGTDQDRAARYREWAEAYMRIVIARGTSTGLLSELIGSQTAPRWAAPHGWAMASFIQSALLLQGLLQRVT